MTRRIPQDPNYRTSCPAAIKAKITELENAVYAYGVADNAMWRCAQPDLDAAQVARYDLERTILTCIEAAVKTALDSNTKRTKRWA